MDKVQKPKSRRKTHYAKNGELRRNVHKYADSLATPGNEMDIIGMEQAVEAAQARQEGNSSIASEEKQQPTDQYKAENNT